MVVKQLSCGVLEWEGCLVLALEGRWTTPTTRPLLSTCPTGPACGGHGDTQTSNIQALSHAYLGSRYLPCLAWKLKDKVCPRVLHTGPLGLTWALHYTNLSAAVGHPLPPTPMHVECQQQCKPARWPAKLSPQYSGIKARGFSLQNTAR